MGDVTLRLVVNGDQLTVLDQAGNKLQTLGGAAQQAGGAGGLGAMTKGAADMVQGIQGSMGIMQQAIIMFGDVQKGGEAVQHAFQALDQMSHGNTPAYMKAMQESTHGLVTDMDLAHAAALGLSTGIASNAAEMAKIVGIGASVGEVFMNDATQGVTMFESALEHVGQTRPLAALGFDITAVKERFAELTKQGMDKADAWKQTLLELAPAFADTGNAWDKMTVKMGDAVDTLKGRAATGFNAIASIIDGLNNKTITIDMVMKSAGAEINGDLNPHGAIIDMLDPGGAAQRKMRQIADIPLNQLIGAPDRRNDWNQPLNQVLGAPDQRTDAGAGSGYTDAELNARMSMWSYQSTLNNPLTAGEREGRRNAQGGYNVTAATSYDPNALGAGMGLQGPNARAMAQGDGAKVNWEQMNTGLMQSEATLRQMEDSGNAVAATLAASANHTQAMDGYMQNVYQSFQKVNSTSLAHTFGTDTANPIYNEVGGGLSADAAAARQKLVKSGASGAALAEFDNNAKTAIDNYKISSGEATPASIKLGDAIADVNKRASEGTIPMAQAAAQLKAYADAAKAGVSDIGQINALLWGQDAQNMGGQAGVGARNRSQSITKAGGSVGADPWAGLEDSMKKVADAAKPASNEIGGITVATLNAATQAPAHMDRVAASFNPVQTQAATTVKAIQAVLDKVKEGGNLSVTITTTSSGPGRS